MISDKQFNENGFIPAHGGYRQLLSYQKSEIIYDGTVHFCKNFFRNMTEPLARWFRQLVPANKTLVKKGARFSPVPLRITSILS